MPCLVGQPLVSIGREVVEQVVEIGE